MSGSKVGRHASGSPPSGSHASGDHHGDDIGVTLDHGPGSHKDVHPITPAPNHQDQSRLRISRITSGSTPDHVRITDPLRITSGSRPDQLWITSGSRPRINGSTLDHVRITSELRGSADHTGSRPDHVRGSADHTGSRPDHRPDPLRNSGS